jgi:hypothetical protein
MKPGKNKKKLGFYLKNGEKADTITRDATMAPR